MTLRIEFRPEAFADVAEAFFYEQQRPALGQDFEAELNHTLELVAEMPHMAPVVYRGLRRALMRRFPYAIYYRADEQLIEVQDDPWARGAYASFRPGQMTSWLPEIARPEGRIHFAGEHTSNFPATMDGAIESGARAAGEIEEV